MIHVIKEGDDPLPGLNFKPIVRNASYRTSGIGKGIVIEWLGKRYWRFRYRRGISPHFLFETYVRGGR